jgi:hypothetical protein
MWASRVRIRIATNVRSRERRREMLKWHPQLIARVGITVPIAAVMAGTAQARGRQYGW